MLSQCRRGQSHELLARGRDCLVEIVLRGEFGEHSRGEQVLLLHRKSGCGIESPLKQGRHWNTSSCPYSTRSEPPNEDGRIAQGNAGVALGELRWQYSGPA